MLPSKSLTNETKTKQDSAGNNAKFPRFARRREALVSKQDPASKPLPQLRQRTYDKKCPPRNADVPANERHRDQVATKEEAEIGSAGRPGSKKLNLNHLLNFTYDDRSSSGSWRGSGPKGRIQSMWTTRKHKYNKEEFLQANCQFVVQRGPDYSVHSADPDLLVDWDWIEQICVSSHEVPSCPICLYPPVAAKMTRCGHIYCWSCMLHYLALSDKTWRKCPICYEAVHKTDLKSVVALATPCFNVGERITMRLMQRQKGSVLVMPKARWRDTGGRPFHVDEDADRHYAKLLVANPRQVLDSIVRREETELEDSLESYKDCPEICFIESAIEQLKERKNVLLSKIGSEVVDAEEREHEEEVQKSLAGGLAEVENSTVPEPVDEESGLNGDDLARPSDEIRVRTVSESSSNGGKAPGKDVFYFYQACDGQHVYMHAVNVHMLVREYGSLDKCPEDVTAVIVEKEGISMNEDLRRRLRYLGHLPLICEFEVVELKLETPVVSAETIEAFADEIEKRQRRRHRRVREERKREYQFQAEENRRLGKTPAAHLRLNSLKHFPECNTKFEFEEGAEATNSTFAIPVDLTPSPKEPDIDGSAATSSCGPSFAQMLSSGKAKVGASSQRFPVTVKARAPEKSTPSSDDDELALHAPSFRDSFYAALQDSLDKNVDSWKSADEPPTASVDGSKKKRRKQKRLLFTTAVTRSK